MTTSRFNLFRASAFSVLILSASYALAQPTTLNLQEELNRVRTQSAAPAADKIPIARVTGYDSNRNPVFERMAHPAPKPGMKVVVIPMSEVEKGSLVEIKFQAYLELACDRMGISGVLKEDHLPMTSKLYWYSELEITGSSSTLRGCLNKKRETKAVEISTPVQGVLKEVYDNMVFYVPEQVDVSAVIYRPSGKISGVSPNN